MRIISRKVITSHSKEEALQIMKNAASRYCAAEFSDNCFQFAFPIRWHKRMGFLPVKGIVNNLNGYTEVRIDIHGGFTLYIGILLFCVGLFALAYSLFVKTAAIYSAMICMGFGIVIYVIDLFDGIVCLDSLEHRLTRKLDK